jgi:hypothetical protein
MTINQVAKSDVNDLVASRLHISAPEHEVEERRRGYGDGIVWARDFATATQLRGFVESFGAGMDGGSERDRFLRNFTNGTENTSVEGSYDFEGPYWEGPYWEGFLDGAEEVFVHGDPPLNT